MRTSLPYRQNIGFKGIERTLKSFHPSSKELNSLRSEKALGETLFEQGEIGDCYLIAAIKSIMFALNEYANKTGKQCFNARNWLRKLVVFDKNGGAKICFPLPEKIRNKVEIPEELMLEDYLSQGNKRVKFLEVAYSHLSKALDKSRVNDHDIKDCLKSNYSFLAMRDITGLKSVRLTQNKVTRKQKELFKKYAGRLFKAFKEHPENLVITLNANKTPPSFTQDCTHSYSLKKVVKDGLILVDPRSAVNEEIKIDFESFYKHFSSIDFTRIQPEKMFNMLEKAKRTTAKALDYQVFRGTAPVPIRDTKYGLMRDQVYFTVKDNVK